MKLDNYLVTATELNEMAVTFGYTTKNGIANSNKAVTKAEASNAYYLDENASPYSTYTSNRCPRYQDFVCAPSGLTITVDTVSVNDETHTNPIYNAEYSYLFKIKSTVPTPSSNPVTFDITLPSNITLTTFRFVHYNNSATTGYTLNVFNTSTGQVQITLTNSTVTEYEIAFNAKANQQYGSFSATGYASGVWCNTVVTASATNSYSLVVPNVSVSKTVSSGAQNGCVTTKQYTVTVSNSGGTLIGGTITDTLPTGLILGQFQAVYYNGSPVPLPTSDYYLINTYQEGTNGGQINISLFKEIGNGNYYTLYFYATNTGASASYTNTANFANGTYTASGSDTSSYTTYPSTTYYQVQGCAASDYAYTAITPLGLNNRYVLPSSGAYYTYTGASVSQCTVPPGYNASLQQTTYYNCCDSTTNWQNNGSYSCYGTCDLYYIQQDVNPCSSTYNQTRQGSVAAYNSTSCGGCCGQSTSANWQNTGGYGCYGTCNLYNIERDTNPCSSTYTQTRQGSLVATNSTSCGGCCGQSTSANWVDNGSTFCSGCTLYQPQIDNNPCSSTYNNTRNVSLGVSSTCGTWNLEYYCVGYDKWSRERNTCTNATRNDTLVETNSPYCGYVPCYIYNIIAYNNGSTVTGTYQGCASGSTNTFTFTGNQGVIGQVCARSGTVTITSGNGTSQNTYTSCT